MSGLRNTALKLAAMLSFLLPGTTVFADNPDLIPQEYRIKIDDVDVSNAPDIRIRATFLDKKTLPVSPKKITYIDVYADDDLVTNKPKISTLKDSDMPLDLALIVPISKRFTKDELEQMKDSMAHIIEQARKNDRVAGFFDDGRAINVVPLGKAEDVTNVLKKVEPQATPSFLYSSLDKAIEEMSDPAKVRPARRAIILVTDAFDTYTFRAADVQKEIFETYRIAKANNIHIYVVMYRPFIRGLIPLFEGLSRKTGGTYRYADFAEQISTGIDYAWGEIYGELILDFRQNVRKGEMMKYWLDAGREGGVTAKSEKSAEVTIVNVKFNWRKFWITMAIIGGVVIVGLIVFLLVRRHRKKKAEEEAAREEQIIQEKIERGEVCPKCRRSMLPGWKECMFCAREAAEEINKQKAEKRKEALAKAEKKGQKLEGRVCPKCGRTMMPQWKDCLFCKAGIGSENAKPQQGVAPTKAAKEKPKETGERICENCGRPMKPHWTTCLYCEADAAQRPAPSLQQPAKDEAKPQDAGVRICENCGRPMKAHWTICLYCEANKLR